MVEHYRVVFLAVSWLDFQLLGGLLLLLLLAYFTFTLQLARVQCYNLRRWFSLHYSTLSTDNILAVGLLDFPLLRGGSVSLPIDANEVKILIKIGF